MKIIAKGIYFPLTLVESPQLTWNEKAAIMLIDAMTDDPMGAKISASSLAKQMNLDTKEAKNLLNTLNRKGAIIPSVDEDGQTRFLALPYKESYETDDTKKDVAGQKPKAHNEYDYDEIQQLWNELNPCLPQLSRFTPKRKRQLRTVLLQNGVSADEFKKAIKIVSISDFLQGRTKTASGQTWAASFDWMVKKTENLDKILAGNYCTSAYEKAQYQRILEGFDVISHEKAEQEDMYK